MKKTLVLLALAFQVCASAAGTLNVRISPVSPMGGPIPERAIVPLLSFELTGEEASITQLSIEREGDLLNNNFGELLLVFEYDKSVRARGMFGTNNVAEMNFSCTFTGQKTFTFTLYLRAWSNLSPFEGKDLTIKLAAIQSSIPITNLLPIVSSPFVFTRSPQVGNIVLTAQARSSNEEIMVNVPHQELASFRADVWNEEDVVAKRMTFMVDTLMAESGVVEEVVLVNDNGSVIAGPVPYSHLGEKAGNVHFVFTNEVTFPRGSSSYRLFGKLSATGFNHNSIILISSAVSLDSWELVGATHGYRIEPWSRNMEFDSVEVATGWVFVTIDQNGSSISVTGGASQVKLSEISFSSWESAEDLQLTKLRLCLTGYGARFATNIQVYLGDVSLNSLNPARGEIDAIIDLVLDAPLLLPKNGTVTLTLRADISGEAFGSAFNVNVCEDSAAHLELVGVTTGTPPYVHIPIQFGVNVRIGGISVIGGTFARDLTVGSRGEDVRMLQYILNSSTQTVIAVSGPGSPGNETTDFTEEMKLAVIEFQILYGISGTGYVGPITRGLLNSREWALAIQSKITSISFHEVPDTNLRAVGMIGIIKPNTEYGVLVSSNLTTWTQCGVVNKSNSTFLKEVVGSINTSEYPDRAFFKLVEKP